MDKIYAQVDVQNIGRPNSSVVVMGDEHSTTFIMSDTTKRGRNTTVSANMSPEEMRTVAAYLIEAADIQEGKF